MKRRRDSTGKELFLDHKVSEAWAELYQEFRELHDAEPELWRFAACGEIGIGHDSVGHNTTTALA